MITKSSKISFTVPDYDTDPPGPRPSGEEAPTQEIVDPPPKPPKRGS